MKTKFTVDFFIKKFSKIPARLWTTGEFVDRQGRRCVLGHCGEEGLTIPQEARELVRIFSNHGLVPPQRVNDGDHFTVKKQFPQKTPKARILAALKWIEEQAKK